MSGVELHGEEVAPRAPVLAVDDSALFLAVLREVVSATSHLQVAGEAHSGEQAVAVALRLRPAMVLMDVRMPGLGGIAAAERIKSDSPSTIVVLISTTHPDELPRTACAEALIWKNRLAPKLLDAIWLHAQPVC
jgi:DNA-binding NarL/FixJ family response regulator